MTRGEPEHVCRFGCSGDDVKVHYGWFRCTPESRAILVEQRKRLAADEKDETS